MKHFTLDIFLYYLRYLFCLFLMQNNALMPIFNVYVIRRSEQSKTVRYDVREW
jgi:hypothetical protein